MRSIQAELRRRLGSDQGGSLSYITNVLREAGVRVAYDDRYVDAEMEEPYATQLQGVLEFGNLESAETSLRRLDALYKGYQAASDPIGVKLVRSLALKGKQRAESLAANPRVNPVKRQEKREIASWFRIWLETPDLLSDWLELRKQSEEFRQFLVDPGGHGVR